MNNTATTYRELFELLVSLGFEESEPAPNPPGARVFWHGKSDTLLAFARQTDDAVTPADWMSAEVHLHQKGIADEPLATLVGSGAKSD